MTTTAGTANVRILQCFTCRTMEEIPDYVGLPEDDHVLQYVDEKHGGLTEQPHHRALLRVEAAHWENRTVRKQIVDQMWSETKGFVPEYYATRQTLQEDALKCFAQHRRQVPCIDYQSHSKRLGNPAAADRKRLSKEMRTDFTGGGPKLYLCSMCPVQTAVDAMKFDLNEKHTY